MPVGLVGALKRVKPALIACGVADGYRRVGRIMMVETSNVATRQRSLIDIDPFDNTRIKIRVLHRGSGCKGGPQTCPKIVVASRLQLTPEALRMGSGSTNRALEMQPRDGWLRGCIDPPKLSDKPEHPPWRRRVRYIA